MFLASVAELDLLTFFSGSAASLDEALRTGFLVGDSFTGVSFLVYLINIKKLKICQFFTTFLVSALTSALYLVLLVGALTSSFLATYFFGGI